MNLLEGSKEDTKCGRKNKAVPLETHQTPDITNGVQMCMKALDSCNYKLTYLRQK